MSITVETHKPTICIDIDGVIADYSKGWQGENHIGDPLPGAKKFLQRLREAGWKIIIFTTRGNGDMERYCDRHGLCYDEINQNSSLVGRNPGKPIATVYLDDRGICFKGNFDKSFEDIMRFKVWYEKEPEKTLPDINNLTEDDLVYAAFARCPCGAGLARIKNCGPNGRLAHWDCSDILLGRAIPPGQEGAKVHTAKLPFQFYEVKSENQPSAEGRTTRPQKANPKEGE